MENKKNNDSRNSLKEKRTLPNKQFTTGFSIIERK